MKIRMGIISIIFLFRVFVCRACIIKKKTPDFAFSSLKREFQEISGPNEFIEFGIRMKALKVITFRMFQMSNKTLCSIFENVLSIGFLQEGAWRERDRDSPEYAARTFRETRRGRPRSACQRSRYCVLHAFLGQSATH